MAKSKTTKVLALVANGDTGFDARNKINAGLTLTGDLESRIDGKADVTYVDSKVSEKISKAGDTMTGDLTISSGKQLVAQTFKTNGSTYEFYPKDGETNKDIYWDFHASSENTDYSHRITFNSEDSTVVFTSPVLTSASQSSSASSLTRKDYVDGAFVKKSGDTMTGPLYFNILYSTESDLRVIHPYAENVAGIYWGNTDQWSRIHAKDGLVQVTDGTSLWKVYHQGFKPTAADVGAIPTTGGTVTGPVTSNVPDNWRIAYGGYGAFWRQDGSNLYLMLTNQGDQNGSYNNLRPFRVNCLNGSVVIGQGLILTAPQQAEPDSATRKDYVDSTVVAVKEELEARIATLEAQIATLLATATTQPVVATRKTRKKKEADNGS